MVDDINRGVKIRVTADTRQAQKSIRGLDKSFKSTDKAAAKTTSSMIKMAGAISAAFSGVVAVKSINKATSGFIEMENQVALVTGRTKELRGQMDKLYTISLKTRSPMEGTAEIFSRMGRALKDTGVGMDELNAAVVTLNKAATISGGSVESQKAAFIQLGQGLAAGALRGQELNSVMEQLPRLSQAIAEELGVGLGQLRAMAQEGKLNSDVVFTAMLNQAEAINDEFENIKITSSKGFALMAEQIGRLVADISEAVGFSQAFADAYLRVATYLDGNRNSIVGSVEKARDAIVRFKSELRKSFEIGRLTEDLQNTLDEIPKIADKALTSTMKIVDKFTKVVVDAFFWVYDEVIGNSWWTDTMEKTYDLAKLWLTKAVEVVRKFAKIVVNYFKNIYYNVGESGFKFDFKKIFPVDGVTAYLKKTMEAVPAITTEYLGKALKAIRYFSKRVVETFFWIYDEVIGNSWWTDTMEETYNLAATWLPKTISLVKNFAGKVNGYFKDVFQGAKGEFEINLANSVKGLSDLGDSVTEVVSDGFKRAINSLTSIDGATRSKITTGMAALFSVAFSTGSLIKTLSKVADKIGPMFKLALIANIVSAVGSPRVFAGFGLLVGEIVGTLGNEIIVSLPAMIKAAFSGFAGFLAGIFKEAGLIGGAAILAGFAIVFIKPLRAALFGAIKQFAVDMTRVVQAGRGSKSFARFGNDKKKNGKVGTLRPVHKFNIVEKQLYKLGNNGQRIFNNLTLSSLNFEKRMHSVGRTLSTSVIPPVRKLGSASLATSVKVSRLGKSFKGVGKTLRRNSAAIAALGISMLAASSSFASGSDEISNSMMNMDLAIMGGLSAISMFAPTIGSLIVSVFSGIGSAAGSVLGSAAATAIATGIKAAAASVFAFLTTWSAGLVAAIAVTGGLLAVIFFGEGDTFKEKFTGIVKWAFGFLGRNQRFNTLENQKDLRRRTRVLANRGQLGTSKFSSKRLSNKIENINFTRLDNKSAKKLLTSMTSLENIAQKARDEDRRFGTVSQATRKELVEAQKATTEAVIKSGGKVGDFSKTAANIARSIFSEVVPTNFFGRPVNDETTKKLFELQGKVIEGLQSNTDPKELLRILSTNLLNPEVLFGEGTDKGQKEVEELFGEDLLKTLKIGLISNEKVSKALVQETFNVLEQLMRVRKAESFGILDFAELSATGGGPALAFLQAFNAISDNVGVKVEKLADASGAGVSQLQTSKNNLGAAEADNPKALIRELTSGAFERLNDILAESKLEEQRPFINTKEAIALDKLAKERDIIAKDLAEVDASRGSGFDDESRVKELDKKASELKLNLVKAEQEIEASLKKAIESGWEKSDFSRLGEVIGLDISQAVMLELMKIEPKPVLIPVETKPKTITLSSVESEEVTTDSSEGIDKNLGEFVIPENTNFLKQSIEEYDKLEKKINEIKSSHKELSKSQLTEIKLHRDSQEAIRDSIELNAKWIEVGEEIKPKERLAMLEVGADLVDLDLDMNKVVSADPAVLDNVNDLTQALLQLKVAGDLLLAGDSSKFKELGLTAANFATAVTTAEKNLTEVISGITKPPTNGGGGGQTWFDKITSRTGLLLDDINSLTIKQLGSIDTALEKILSAEKLINKAGIEGVNIRKQQAEVIKEQEEIIERILLSGTVNQARAGLDAMGIDESVVEFGPAAISQAIKLQELREEHGRVNVDQQGAILEQIKRQEKVLERMTEDREPFGLQIADAFTSDLSTGISDALKSGDIGEAFETFADSFTSTVVDTFVNGMVEALLGDSIQNLFSGLFNFGDKGINLADKMTEGSEGKGDSVMEKVFPSLFGGEKGSGLFGKDGPFSKFFGEGGGMSKMLGGVFGADGFFSKIFGGLFGGGGAGGLFSTIGGFLGFDQGGVVPSTKYSQAGKDSVPALLKPGERVIDPRKSRSDAGSGYGQSTVVNLAITGDVSRQTRKEIMSMMPQIAVGVNSNNKERGRK